MKITTPNPLKVHRKKIVLLSKIFGVFIVIIFGLMLMIPSLFSEEIEEIIEKKANESLVTKLDFSSTEVTFFRHFPSLTFSIDEVSLKESGDKKTGDLLTAKEIYFKINIVKLLFRDEVKINGIVIDEANFNFKKDKSGLSNYNVYNEVNQAKKKPDSTTTQNSDLFLEIDEFIIKNSDLVYEDQSTKIKIKATDFDLKGDGSFILKDVFLKTKLTSKSFDLHYDGIQYINDKKVDADLQTKFNSEELTFKFNKNAIYIKQLPVYFKGEFSMLESGYYVDFDIDIEDTDLVDIFSAFPPKYENWTKKTKISGNTNANFALKGYYRPLKNENFDIDITFNTTEASISSPFEDQSLKDIYVDATLHIPELDVERMDILIKKFQLSLNEQNISGQYINRHDENGLFINNEIKGALNLNNLSKALSIDGLDLKGVMDMDVTSRGYYNPEELKFPKSQGKFTVRNAALKTPYYINPLSQINASIELSNLDNSFKSTRLSLDTLNFRFEDETFTAKANFENFENINYDINANGKFNLNKFYTLFGKQVDHAEGYIEANLNLKGKESNFSNETFVDSKNSGLITFNDITVQFPAFLKPFLLKDGQLEFSGEKTKFSNFKFTYGNSYLQANGKFNNLISYTLSQNKTLDVDLNLESEYLNLNEFIPSFDAKSNPNYDDIEIDTNSTDTYGVFDVPDRINLKADISAKNMIYDSLNLRNLKAVFKIENESLFIVNSTFEMIGSRAALSGNYTNKTRSEGSFDLKIDIYDFDIQRAYDEIYLFRELVTAAAYAEGISSVNYQLSGKLDGEMSPILPSLEGRGVLRVKKAKIQGYKLFGAISKATNNTAFSNADLKAIEIPSRIKDNIVTIDEFKLKTGMFRLKSEGEFSFDEQINFKMRLGLPPLGIIGIPINITGSSEDYSIKLGKKTEDLESVSYEQYIEMQKDSSVQKSLDRLQLQKLEQKYNPTPKIKVEENMNNRETDTIKPKF